MITSTSNPRVGYVRSLYQKRTRLSDRLLPVEGLRLIEEVLSTPWRPEVIYFDPEAVRDSERAAKVLELASEAKKVAVTGNVLKAMADTTSPQGLLALVPLPDEPLQFSGHLVVVLDGLRDPGNAGSILRTADAGWVQTVASTPETVDLFGPKVIRAGMGAQFRLSLFPGHDWDDLEKLCGARRRLLAAPAGGRHYSDIDWSQPTLLVVGGEASGPSAVVRDMAVEMVSIPMKPGVESLNAAVAASILIMEAAKIHWR